MRCIFVHRHRLHFIHLGKQSKRSLSLSLASCSPVPIVRSNCTVMGREREREICLVPGLIKVIDTAKGGRWTLDNDLALDNHNLSFNKMKVREIVTKCC
jgi:hypothetical protein